MKAIILAAGRGERMRPLSDNTPKALLQVQGKPLIDHHINNLKNAGISEVIINLHHLGHKIKDHVGDGSKYNIKINYSEEFNLLETGGGMKNALKYLGTEPFIYIGADIYTDFDFTKLNKDCSTLAHIVLVDNPSFKTKGDFNLDNTGIITQAKSPDYTFACIGVINPKLFQPITKTQFPLIEALDLAIENRQVSGEIFSGIWHNVGTPQQLAEVNRGNAA